MSDKTATVYSERWSTAYKKMTSDYENTWLRRDQVKPSFVFSLLLLFILLNLKFHMGFQAIFIWEHTVWQFNALASLKHTNNPLSLGRKYSEE